jgi:hypothetical protein
MRDGLWQWVEVEVPGAAPAGCAGRDAGGGGAAAGGSAPAGAWDAPGGVGPDALAARPRDSLSSSAAPSAAACWARVGGKTAPWTALDAPGAGGSGGTPRCAAAAWAGAAAAAPVRALPGAWAAPASQPHGAFARALLAAHSGGGAPAAPAWARGAGGAAAGPAGAPSDVAAHWPAAGGLAGALGGALGGDAPLSAPAALLFDWQPPPDGAALRDQSAPAAPLPDGLALLIAQLQVREARVAAQEAQIAAQLAEQRAALHLSLPGNATHSSPSAAGAANAAAPPGATWCALHGGARGEGGTRRGCRSARCGRPAQRRLALASRTHHAPRRGHRPDPRRSAPAFSLRDRPVANDWPAELSNCCGAFSLTAPRLAAEQRAAQLAPPAAVGHAGGGLSSARLVPSTPGAALAADTPNAAQAAAAATSHASPAAFATAGGSNGGSGGGGTGVFIPRVAAERRSRGRAAADRGPNKASPPSRTT